MTHHQPPRVLYVHGLESGPDGKKPRALAEAGCAVIAKEMPCGPKRALSDPAVLAAAAAGSMAAVIAATQWGWKSVVASALAWRTGRPHFERWIAGRMLERSVAVQEQALASHEVDVVVGSSFGGAVVLELLRRGAWKGPTVLLCPAHLRVAERAGVPWTPLERRAELERTLIVHGREDEVVPYEHSVQLAEELGAELRTVSDDHRLTRSATAHGLRSWIDHVLPASA
jgi:predicted alpha/beta hydrolase family esterase